VPRIGMFSAPGAVLGQPSTSAVILLLLPADAIRILVRLRRAVVLIDYEVLLVTSYSFTS
jgi:hypothetical protein